MSTRIRQAKENIFTLFEDSDENDLINQNTKWNLNSKLNSISYNCDLIKKYSDANAFDISVIENDGFKTPILFENPDGLNLKLPEFPDFSVNDVAGLVGKQRVLDVVDVNTQDAIGMTMKNWCKYYNSPQKTQLLNVISLEFSQTKLDKIIKAPDIVTQLDWLENYWPNKDFYKSADNKSCLKSLTYPKVRKYCLMSVGGCFTDFHIDLGGTSVWYHIFKGEKVFWMIPPTEDNLLKYEKWCQSIDQSSHFFPDLVDQCQRVHLKQGNTFMIPSGWIHGVYTPVDSLVFGGNFLHSFSINMQLRIWLVEQKLKVDIKYRYPFFVEMHWFVLAQFVQSITNKHYIFSSIEKNRKIKCYETENIPIIAEWLKSVSLTTNRNIPGIIIDPQMLIDDAENIDELRNRKESKEFVSFFDKYSNIDFLSPVKEKSPEKSKKIVIKCDIGSPNKHEPSSFSGRNIFDSLQYLSEPVTKYKSESRFLNISPNKLSKKRHHHKQIMKHIPELEHAEIPLKMYEMIASTTKSRKITRPDRFVEHKH